MHARAALWGDALRPQEPGHVALVSQSGNVAVNALATRRGLRFHTVVSCGNQAVLSRRRLPGAARPRRGDPLDRRLPGGRRRRRPALRRAGRLRRDRRARGGAEGGRHRRRAPRPPRPTRARSRATSACSARWWRRPARSGPTTSTSCSSWPRCWPCRERARPGGAPRSSPARAATPAWAPTRPPRSGSSCRRSPMPRWRACARSCPVAATVANPLDYTAMIWGDVPALSRLIQTVARRRVGGPAARVLRPAGGPRRRPGGVRGARCARGSRRERRRCACRSSSPPPCPSCSTTRPPGASPRRACPPPPGCAPGCAVPPRWRGSVATRRA